MLKEKVHIAKLLTEKWIIRRPFSNGLRYMGIPSFKTHFVSPGLINSPVTKSEPSHEKQKNYQLHSTSSGSLN